MFFICLNTGDKSLTTLNVYSLLKSNQNEKDTGEQAMTG